MTMMMMISTTAGCWSVVHTDTFVRSSSFLPQNQFVISSIACQKIAIIFCLIVSFTNIYDNDVDVRIWFLFCLLREIDQFGFFVG